MRIVGLSLLLLVAALLPARAADPWGIAGEKEQVVIGQVVDVLCHLKKDCPANCGGGRRQLGIVDAEGRLRMVAKGQVDFANAVPDLLAYCGKRIEADGLLIENPVITLFFLQRIRHEGSADFQPAERFIQEWTARNGASSEWFRDDPETKAIIGEVGPLGIKGLVPPPQ
ncbi:MAG: hypothetical protein CTY25_08095 [Methylobacterium sp.]|nr:MAG: hypothetical protein CTY25_08095 [Methylobacterium sp.]